ncbi:ROK family protein [Erwinia sp. S38]|uniref:ROK family protein n=1 Tax=Erwinia sp. S38 TaxID=2769338 RepID=UPI001909E552|nr:ROK family protein [Erwinia sp. S38]MBK0000922.1 ROK family protein [Erwinia sp. S38]
MNTPLSRTTREMKKSNIALVIGMLKSLGTATKGELAQQTGLSSATCGAVLNELTLTGEVLALEFEASRGGRPAQRYACNPDFFSVLSLYAAGSDARAELVWAVSSATGNLLAQGEMPFLPLTVETFDTLIASLLAKYPGVRVIGIGLPGVVVDDVVGYCDISLFSGLPIAARTARQTGCFTQAGNDLNYTVWGFYRSSCAGVSAPVAYLYKPDVHYPGCGMVIDGKVLTGVSNFAGEVLHLPFNVEGEPPLVEGMAKTLVSLTALINPRTVAVAGDNIRADHLPEMREICLRYVPEKHLPELIYRDSIRQDYLQGIADRTLQQYNYHRLYAE